MPKKIRSALLTKLKNSDFWPWRGRRSAQRLLEVVHNLAQDEAIVDLVAVHGIDGNFDAWTLETGRKFPFRTSSNKSWLTPDLLPHARILTFSYHTSIHSTSQLTTVVFGAGGLLAERLSALREKTNSRNRPIIFVAHGIGGLLVEAALISCYDPATPERYDVGECTSAVHFFGTPSSGRNPQYFPDALRTFFSLMSDQSDAYFGEEILELVEDKLQQFKALMANIHVYTYYESKETDSIGKLVVQRQPSAKRPFSMPSETSEHSASSTGSYRTVLPNRDHANLMKFARSDEHYQNFKKNLQDSLERKLDRGAESHEGSPAGSFVDLEASSGPGGLHTLSNIRKEEAVIMDSLELTTIFEQHLSSSREAAGFPILLLHGASNTERSMCASSLASLALTETPNVFMYRFNAETDATIIGGYLELARSLRGHYGHPGDDIGGCAAGYLNRCIGIRNIDEMLSVDSIRSLEEIHIRSVIQAVHQWLLVPQNQNWLLIFDNVVDPHGIYEMLPLRASGRIILTAKKPEGVPVGRREVVPMMAKVDDISLPLRREALDDIWFGDGERLVRNILAVGSVLLDSPIHSGLLSFENKHFRGFTTEVLDGMAQRGLLEFTRQPDETNGHVPPGVQFVIPQHVRSAFLERLERSKDLDNWVSVAGGLCIEFYRRVKKTRDLLVIQACERIMVPHACACYRWMKTRHKKVSGPLPVAILGDICLGQGALEEAEWFFQMSLSQAAALDHQADVILLLSTVLLRKGKTKQCLEHLQTLDFDKMIEDASLRLVAVKTQLTKAEALKIDERLDCAEREIRKALDYMDDLESDLPRDECVFTFSRAHAARKLAENLMSRYRWERSKGLYDRAFYEYRQLLGPHDPLTIETGEELANIMYNCAGEVEALELLRIFYKNKTDSLGRGHPYAARVAAKIAGLFELSHSEEVKKQYDDALRTMADTLGPHHPWVMQIKEAEASQLAENLWVAQASKDAIEIFDEVIRAKLSSTELYGEDAIESSRNKRDRIAERLSYDEFRRKMEEDFRKALQEQLGQGLLAE